MCKYFKRKTSQMFTFVQNFTDNDYFPIILLQNFSYKIFSLLQNFSRK